MTGVDSRVRGFVAAAALSAMSSACDGAPAQLPAGRVLTAAVIDEQSAVVVVADFEREAAVLAVVDPRGVPRWTLARPLAGLASDYQRLHLEVAGELVLLAGHGLVAAERARGALRWQLPGNPDDPPTWKVLDGQILRDGYTSLAVIEPATGGDRWHMQLPEQLPRFDRILPLSGEYIARTHDITRWIAEPGPGVVMHDGSRVGAAYPGEGPRERFELVRGSDGAVVWQAEVAGHCRVGDTLFASTADGTLLAVDLAADAPQARVVAERLLHRPWRWQLAACQQIDGAWWLRQDGLEGTYLLHRVDGETGAHTRRGVCSGITPVLAGRFALLSTPPLGPGIAAYDLERGVVAWRQGPDAPLPDDVAAFRAGDLIYAHTHADALRRVVAVDPTTGELTGATALRGSNDLVVGDLGPAWVFAEMQLQRGPAPVVTVDRRTLRPLGAAVAGLDIVDTGAETRADLQTGPGLVAADLVWDPDTGLTDAAFDDPPCRRTGSAG